MLKKETAGNISLCYQGRPKNRRPSYLFHFSSGLNTGQCNLNLNMSFCSQKVDKFTYPCTVFFIKLLSNRKLQFLGYKLYGIVHAVQKKASFGKKVELHLITTRKRLLKSSGSIKYINTLDVKPLLILITCKWI